MHWSSALCLAKFFRIERFPKMPVLLLAGFCVCVCIYLFKLNRSFWMDGTGCQGLRCSAFGSHQCQVGWKAREAGCRGRSRGKECAKVREWQTQTLFKVAILIHGKLITAPVSNTLYVCNGSWMKWTWRALPLDFLELSGLAVVDWTLAHC